MIVIADGSSTLREYGISCFFCCGKLDIDPMTFIYELATFLLLITVTFIDFTRVSPPGGCHPHLFLPVRPRLSTILCKFAHNFFPSAVTTWRVSPGTVRPLVTPLFLPELAELGFRKLSYHRQTDRQTGIQTYRHAEMPAKTLPENITGIYYAALRLVRLHFRMCHVSC